MVNLKDFLLSACETELSFLTNIDTLLKYIKKSDPEFTSKILKATNDIFRDKNTPEKTNYYCLHFINLAVQLNSPLFNQKFEKELANTFLNFVDEYSENPNLKETIRGVSKNFSSDDGTKYPFVFYELLFESIEYWYSHNISAAKIYQNLFECLQNNNAPNIDSPVHVLKYIYLLKGNSQKQPMSKINTYEKKSSEIILSKADKKYEEFVKATQFVVSYLQDSNEADDRLNIFFGAFSESVQELMPFDSQLNDSQNQGLTQGILFLDIYDQADDYESLRSAILISLKQNAIFLEKQKEENNNPDKIIQIENKRTSQLEPSILFSRSIEKKSTELRNSVEEICKKSSVKKSKSIEKKSSEIFPRKSNQNFSERQINERTTENTTESNNDQYETKKSRFSKPINLGDDFELKSQQSVFLGFVDAERKRLQDKIQELEVKNANLEQKNANNIFQINGIQQKLDYQTKLNKTLETELLKTENIIENFIKNARGFFGEHLKDSVKKIGLTDFNQRSSIKEQYPQLITENHERTYPVNLKPNQTTSLYSNLEPINSPISKINDFPLFNHGLDTKTSIHANFQSNKNELNNYEQKIDNFDGVTNDLNLNYLKDTLKANNDFVNGFNSEISSILNRKKEPQRGLESARNIRQTNNSVASAQDIQTNKFDISSDIKFYNNGSGLCQVKNGNTETQNNIYENYLEQYKLDRPNNIDLTNRDLRQSQTEDFGINREKNNLLKNPFFGGVHDSILNGIMKFKR